MTAHGAAALASEHRPKDKLQPLSLERPELSRFVVPTVGPRGAQIAELNRIPTNDERPRRRGLVSERVANGR
jgi:hypothetical protein